MAITDKTRKILWGRSGNRCAFCRKPLVIEGAVLDHDSVVGEEAHIVSGALNGPRHDVHFPIPQLDTPDNLILLCAVHHKQIDDQVSAFPADMLREMKQKHENWVKVSIAAAPETLFHVTSGKLLADLIHGSYGTYLDHEDSLSHSETEMIGTFMQDVTDWADVADELGPLESVRLVKHFQNAIDELQRAGFFVFGGTELQRLEGGINGPENWPVRHLSVLRNTNPRIVRSPCTT
jgi:hypothetical protein